MALPPAASRPATGRPARAGARRRTPPSAGHDDPCRRRRPSPPTRSAPGPRPPSGACRCGPRRSPPGRPAAITPPPGRPDCVYPARVAAASSSAGVNRPRHVVRSRSCISSPRSSSNGSMTACESLPRVSGEPASRRARAGPIPSARSCSVVGQMQHAGAGAAERRDVGSLRWVACTAVVVGSEERRVRAGARSGSSRSRPAVAAFSAGCSERWTCRGRSPAAATTAAIAACGTARTEWSRPPRSGCVGPSRGHRARRPGATSPSPNRTCSGSSGS